MKVTDLTSLYQHELKDLFSVEKQLAQALTKLAEAATNEQLKQIFQEHREETVAQGEKIAELLKAQSISSGTRHKCKGIAGIIEEGEEIIAIEAGEGQTDVKDAGLIAAAQRAEHYEMAAYGTAAALAGQLQLTDDQKVLKEILEQEKAADKKLTALATGEVNQEAEAAEATSGESTETKKNKGPRAMGRRDEYDTNQGQGGRDQEYGQYAQRGNESGRGRSNWADRDEYDRGADESGRYSTSGGRAGSGGQYGTQGGQYGGQGQYSSNYGNQGNYGGQGQYNSGGGYDRGSSGQSYGQSYGQNYGQGSNQGYGQGGGRGEYGSYGSGSSGGTDENYGSSGRYGSSSSNRGYGNESYGSSGRSGSGSSFGYEADEDSGSSGRSSNRSSSRNRDDDRSSGRSQGHRNR